MMYRILLFLLLFPLCLFGEVMCSYSSLGAASEIVITCWGDGAGSGGQAPEYILTEEACENLKSTAIDALDNALEALTFARVGLTDIQNTTESNNETLSDFDNLLTTNQSALAAIGVYAALRGYYNTLYERNHYIYDVCVGGIGQIDSSREDVEDSLDDLRSFSCADGTCSPSGGSGSAGNTPVTCPCTAEFNRLLQAAGEANYLLGTISTNTAELVWKAVEVVVSVSNLTQSVTSLVSRLNAPDDRMWSEIQDIYQNAFSNQQEVATSSLYLSQIFYQIRELIRGSGQLGDDGNLKLSTEGVILLNQLAFDMAKFSIDQYGVNAFTEATRYFSNTVSTLFHLFNSTPLSSGYMPSSSRYNNVYFAMTNFHISAEQRYNRLRSNLGAGVSNWFERIELYLQSQLGWFDTPLSDSAFQDAQNSLTESQLEQYAFDTTNDLNSVVLSSSNIVTRLQSESSSFVSEFSHVEITASLPSRLTFLPEITTSLGSFGPVVLEISDYSTELGVVRKCTTLIWKVLFWVLYLGICFCVCRVVFILVLYVLHLVKDL